MEEITANADKKKPIYRLRFYRPLKGAEYFFVLDEIFDTLEDPFPEEKLPDPAFFEPVFVLENSSRESLIEAAGKIKDHLRQAQHAKEEFLRLWAYYKRIIQGQ